MKRRDFIFGAAAIAAAGSATSSFAVAAVAQADRIDQAFEAPTADEALALLFPGMQAVEAAGTKLAAPLIVTAAMPVLAKAGHATLDLRAAALIAEGAARPLVGYAEFDRPARGFGVKCNVGRSGMLSAYLLTDRGLLVRSQFVKVTLGGYGTNTN